MIPNGEDQWFRAQKYKEKHEIIEIINEASKTHKELIREPSKISE